MLEKVVLVICDSVGDRIRKPFEGTKTWSTSRFNIPFWPIALYKPEVEAYICSQRAVTPFVACYHITEVGISWFEEIEW